MSRTLHKSCSAHRRPRLLRTPGGGVQCQLFLPAHCLTGKTTDEIVDRRQTMYYTALSSRPSAGLSCHKGTLSSIARITPAVASCWYATTGGQREIKWDHRISAAVIRAPAGEPVAVAHQLPVVKVYRRAYGGTVLRLLGASAHWVYPRACGGTERNHGDAKDQGGLSPRLRGNLCCQERNKPS